jgi:hypothetical protein
MEFRQSQESFKELEGTHKDQVEVQNVQESLLKHQHIILSDNLFLLRSEETYHQVDGRSQRLFHLGSHYQTCNNIQYQVLFLN